MASSQLFVRFLARELVLAREQAGLEQEDAAARLHISPSQMSRIENAKSVPKGAYVELLGAHYGLDDETIAYLIRLLETAVSPPWWSDLVEQRHEVFEALLTLENKAYRIRTYDHYSVPGLLQTAPYARAINASLDLGLSNEQKDKDVTVRMERQARVWSSSSSSMEASFLIDESAFHRLPILLDGGDRRAQLVRLLDPPNGATLQIVPFSAGATPSLATYNIFDLDLGSRPARGVMVEGSTASQHGSIVEDKEEVTRFELIWGQTQAKALTPEESRLYIRQLMEDTHDE